MSKYYYSEEEQNINNVLKYQSEQLKRIVLPDMSEVDARIAESEDLLRSLGYSADLVKAKHDIVPTESKKVMVVPAWDALCSEAERAVGGQNDLESICITSDSLRPTQTLSFSFLCIQWVNIYTRTSLL